MVNTAIILFSVLLGGQFLLSGWAKLSNFHTFSQILAKYSLPNLLQHNKTVYLIIVYELLTALCLLSLQNWLIWFGFFSAFLFVSSANILLLKRLIQGDKNIKCGCNENLEKEVNTTSLLIRNCFLLLILLFGLFNSIPTIFFFSKTTLTYYLIGFGLLAITKLFFAGLRAFNLIGQWKAAG